MMLIHERGYLGSKTYSFINLGENGLKEMIYGKLIKHCHNLVVMENPSKEGVIADVAL